MKKRKMMRGIVIWTIVSGACFGFIMGFTITPITSSIMAILIPAFLGIILFYSNKNRKIDAEEEPDILTPGAYVQLKLFGIFILSFTILAFFAAWIRYNEERKVIELAEKKNQIFIETLNEYNTHLKGLEKISNEFLKRSPFPYEALPSKNQTQSDSVFFELIQVMLKSQKELVRSISQPGQILPTGASQTDEKNVLGFIADTTTKKIKPQDNICKNLNKILEIVDSTSSKSFIQHTLDDSPALEYFCNLNVMLELDAHEIFTIINQFKIDLCD